MARYTLPSVSTFDDTFDSTFQDLASRPRGSVGGSTFQKIGSQFCIRHRVPINNKRSSRQTHSRNRFESVQGNWRTLSDVDKQSFRDEAINYPREDSLEQEYTMSGINLQNSANTNSWLINESFIDEMPAPVAPPVIEADTLAINLGNQSMDIVTNPAVLPSTHSMLIYVTPLHSPGRLAPGAPFAFLGLVPPGFDTNINWLSAYQALWGQLTNANEGQVFSCQLQFIAQMTFINGLTISTVSQPTLI